MGLTQLDTKDQYTAAIAPTVKGLVVIDCYAQWCGPCKKLAPQLERLASEKPTAHFYKLDVEVNEQVAKERNITAMPTLLFFKDGKFLGDFCGANINGIRETVEKLA